MPFALRVHAPDLRGYSGSDGSDNGSRIPVVLVEEPAECAWTFDWGVLRSGVAVSVKEGEHERVKGLKVVRAGEEGLDGVEYGSGFFVHETVSVLTGT